jgi:molybdenum cofactor cytidylyltransferase
MHPDDVVLLVLAAGGGRRLGGVAKALLPAGELSYLARISASAGAAGVRRGGVVVAPPYAAAVAAEARRLGWDVIEHAQPEEGMARSVECGFAWAGQRSCEAALLWPCDHPLVSAATVGALISAIPAGADAAVPTFEGRGGHPALVRRRLFAAMAGCGQLPQGARSVLRAASVWRFEQPEPGCLADIDEPAAARAVALGEVG